MTSPFFENKMNLGKIDPSKFYRGTYRGHNLKDLDIVFSSFNEKKVSSFWWLAGDSSLDNKYWIKSSQSPAIKGYERIFKNSTGSIDKCVPDVAYCVNNELNSLSPLDHPYANAVCINTSVEESTLSERMQSGLLEQDVFIRDHIDTNDVLIVSVGGNDVVLKPSFATIMSLAWICKFASVQNIKDGSALGFGHLMSIFRDNIEKYIQELTTRNKPKRVLVCSLYFPDMNCSASWAEKPLRLLGYNDNNG